MGFLGFYSSLHVSLYRLTRGRIGGKLWGADVLLLTTTGWKTGIERTRPVLYFRDANRLVIIASNGGRRRDPSWWMNLERNPIGKVQIRGERQTVYAQRVNGSERDRLWALAAKMYPGYLDYQKKTSREIPVVALMPRQS